MVRKLNMDIYRSIDETRLSRWKGKNGRHMEGSRYVRRSIQSPGLTMGISYGTRDSR